MLSYRQFLLLLFPAEEDEGEEEEHSRGGLHSEMHSSRSRDSLFFPLTVSLRKHFSPLNFSFFSGPFFSPIFLRGTVT